jgi:hypothetical protein
MSHVYRRKMNELEQLFAEISGIYLDLIKEKAERERLSKKENLEKTRGWVMICRHGQSK